MDALHCIFCDERTALDCADLDEWATGQSSIRLPGGTYRVLLHDGEMAHRNCLDTIRAEALEGRPMAGKPIMPPIVVDDIERPYPALCTCRVCGRAPEVSTGYERSDGTPLIPGGCGPYLIRCGHGRTGAEQAQIDAIHPRRIASWNGGLLLIVQEYGSIMYRSWDFDRAVAGWNSMNTIASEAA